MQLRGALLHASHVILRSRSQLGLPDPATPQQDKWQWRRTALSLQTKRKPQPPRNTEQLSAQFLRMARQQAQQHHSSASSHRAARQPPTPPPRRRTNTPTKSSSRKHPQQAESEGDEANRPANPQAKQDMRHTVPASRILPPRAKAATMGQQRFWRAIVPKPFCQLREGEKPRALTYDIAAANQFSCTLEELTEGSGLSADIIHSPAWSTKRGCRLLNATTLDVAQGVYRVVFVCQLTWRSNH